MLTSEQALFLLNHGEVVSDTLQAAYVLLTADEVMKAGITADDLSSTADYKSKPLVRFARDGGYGLNLDVLASLIHPAKETADEAVMEPAA